uniref:Malonyl-[acyl-carrier protein] O-methyltransferase n=1 Tax=Candidatus Kentrum sp. MB TaxID=2138164 RepID=A0A450XC99_9GAMM|nr:MAG: malonyl-CoA O-methyltransferase [Candidatus Kentron sp. MB]VFK31170.1 MAG: malonyl-CoA O-methyltransferase [Candidatus Kentron sp. MB]VFK75376.1 MAG: malonyl-CoA O-methyltransferase [Candidatus Kentron sp. MB]
MYIDSIGADFPSSFFHGGFDKDKMFAQQTMCENCLAFPPPGSSDSVRVDKRKVRESFDRAALRYDEIAELQRTIGDRLLAHLDPVRLQPDTVLDMGAGTGYCLPFLENRYPEAHMVVLDLAEIMVKEARTKNPTLEKGLFLCGDAEHLPLRENSIDLLFSNVAVQWCNDLEGVCREFARILRPNGLLAFTTFGPDTLWELRDSWEQVDANSHVNTFLDMHDIGDILLHTGFTGIVMDKEEITCTYETVRTLMRDLKTLGAHNATTNRPRGLTGKRRIQAMMEAYEGHRKNGCIPATYEVIYAHGWLPETL